MSGTIDDLTASLLRAAFNVHAFKPQGDGCRCHLPEDDPIHALRIDPDGYATVWSHGLETLRHLGGVDWVDAPAPPRRHTCWPQTVGFFLGSGLVHRCACGAISRGDGDWWDRNTRDASPLPWWRRALTLFRPTEARS